jgi:hypothetical protein
MDAHTRQILVAALSDLRDAEVNLPPEPRNTNETVGGYFYNEWSPEYARWVKMRGSLAHARQHLEELLGEAAGPHAERA